MLGCFCTMGYETAVDHCTRCVGQLWPQSRAGWGLSARLAGDQAQTLLLLGAQPWLGWGCLHLFTSKGFSVFTRGFLCCQHYSQWVRLMRELVHVFFLSSALVWHKAPAASAEFFQVWNEFRKWICHVIQVGRDEGTQASTAKSRRDIADTNPGCSENILNQLKKESSTEW